MRNVGRDGGEQQGRRVSSRVKRDEQIRKESKRRKAGRKEKEEEAKVANTEKKTERGSVDG